MTSLPKIDLHVRILGNGKTGSGCRASAPWWEVPLVNIMARDIGLKASVADPLLDMLYVQKLAPWAQSSSFDEVVILACDHLYDKAGNCYPGGRASMFRTSTY